MCAEATKEVCTIDDSPNVILTLEEIQQLQASDLSLSRLINLVKVRKPEDWTKSNLGTLGPYARLLARQDKLQIVNDVLLYQQTPVIPSSNIEGLVQRFHVASGHMGRDKILAAIQKYYYSLELAKVVSVVIQKCIICQTYKGNSRGGEPQLRRMAHKVYEQYAIDLLELEPARGNARYLLVGVDVLSRFMNAIPIKDKCAGTVVAALEQRVFPNLARIPSVIITDNGPEFRAKEFEKLLGKYSITHFKTVPYVPQSNGRIERLNRTLQQLLATACAESKLSWLDELPRVLIMYNHSTHSQTGKAPSEFLAAEDVKLPLPQMKPWRESSPKFKPYQEGELVGHKLPCHVGKGKLAPRYQGPCRVLEAEKNGLTYEIKCNGETKSKKVHYKQLKPWYGEWPIECEELPSWPEQPDSKPPGISIQEQLENRFDLSKVLMNSTQLPSLNSPTPLPQGSSPLLQDGPSEEEPISVPDPPLRVRGALDDPPPAPPPSPVGYAPVEQPIEDLLSPPATHITLPEIGDNYQSMSPQMLTRNMRRQLATERALQDRTFEGFGEVLATSTPRQSDVLRRLISEERDCLTDSDEEDEVVVYSRVSDAKTSLCSTCAANRSAPDCVTPSSQEG